MVLPLQNCTGCRGAVPTPLGLNYRLKHSEFLLLEAEKALEELGLGIALTLEKQQARVH